MAESDTALVVAARDGDERAFGELIARCNLELRVFVAAHARDRDQLEEVCQATWVAAWQGLRGFSGTAQGLSEWIGSHTRTFAFIGGAPATVVSDNLRSGITKACFYEPAVNRTYAEMAAHYNTAIVPALPYRARDKAKVEVAVQIATRFIIAKLRNRQFFSLCALNEAIAALVAQINTRMSRHLGASRRALFEDLERSALKPLPAEPYVFAEWKECRVGLDYHV